MQSNRLILVSSLAALVLCAAPYGCSGKYSSTGPSNIMSDGSSANIPHTDGQRSVPTYTDGSAHQGSPGDGQYVPNVDGQFIPGGDGHGSRDGAFGSDGGLISDGNGTFPEGQPNYADGVAGGDGWDAQGDGAPSQLGDGAPDYPEGHADGSPG